jgi:hypothetical protein
LVEAAPLDIPLKYDSQNAFNSTKREAPMASAIKPFNETAASKRLSQFIDNLSIDEVRVLSRLLSNWQKRDQRSHPRTACSIVTEYMVENQIHKDLIKNISLGGAFIQSQRNFPVDRVISQSFFFPNFEVPIRSNSRIVWTSDIGFGVEFEMLDADR